MCERGSGGDEIFSQRASRVTPRGPLRSIPKLDTNHARLIPISGSPVDLTNMPKGCPFAARCDKCMKICLTERPQELTINDDHNAACWMNVKQVYDEAARGGVRL